jgi:hypothetical protein
LSDPWNFPNEFTSPSGQQCLRYNSLGEFSQGSPLNGECFWVLPDSLPVQLPGIYGGPPVWNDTGQRVALPLWQPSMLGGTKQHLAVLDTQSRRLVVFQQSLQVLHLHAFNGLLVTGLDSPVYNPKPLLFNLETAAIKHVFEL